MGPEHNKDVPSDKINAKLMMVSIPLQEGIIDPPSISCISRLLRGSERLPRDDDGRKDYSIHGILGGELFGYLYTSLANFADHFFE